MFYYLLRDGCAEHGVMVSRPSVHLSVCDDGTFMGFHLVPNFVILNDLE